MKAVKCPAPALPLSLSLMSLIESATSTHIRRSQKLIAQHTRAGAANVAVVPKAYSSYPPCTQRTITGKLGSNSTKERWC